MRFVGGTLLNIAAGTEVALSSHSAIDANDKVLAVKFKSKPGNTGISYIGITGMSLTDGWELAASGEDTDWIKFGEFGGSVKASDIFADVATTNDDVDFLAILV